MGNYKQIQNLVKKNPILSILIIIVIIFVCERLIGFMRIHFSNNNLENFENNNEKTLVYYYMNGCGHCEKFTPIWEKFKKSFSGSINIIKVEQEDAKDDINKFEVSGFPTVLLLDSNNNKIKEFNGDRTVAGLTEFVNSN